MTDMMKWVIPIVLVLLILLLWWSRLETLIDRPKSLAPYLGYWIWQSDDGLRREVISIDYGGDNRFLRINKTFNIRKWYPPVHPGDPALVAPAEKWTETPPLYRVIVISPTEIYCKSVEPTYAEIPFHIKLLDNGTYIEIKDKKYINSNKLDPTKITFHL